MARRGVGHGPLCALGPPLLRPGGGRRVGAPGLRAEETPCRIREGGLAAEPLVFGLRLCGRTQTGRLATAGLLAGAGLHGHALLRLQCSLRALLPNLCPQRRGSAPRGLLAGAGCTHGCWVGFGARPGVRHRLWRPRGGASRAFAQGWAEALCLCLGRRCIQGGRPSWFVFTGALRTMRKHAEWRHGHGRQGFSRSGHGVQRHLQTRRPPGS
mmetsp:Transcript_83391/g.234499  ORF Transcript_83391/g.234499 Transcript_83391/m.234499 type:complete len:212 (+) Transcript_83391:144-779(+)